MDIPIQPDLGVDTFFDFYYNVGRNGAKWGIMPKTDQDGAVMWEKALLTIPAWINLG
jgi:hypothetical protein